VKIVFAETETGQGDPERGVALLDEALATADGAARLSAQLRRPRPWSATSVETGQADWVF
jgi:hypothetical protein